MQKNQDKISNKNTKKSNVFSKRRVFIQWILLPITIIVIFFGWKYPVLGFFVPLIMLIGILGSFFNGRFVCGNICPRGAFYDRLISKISQNKKVPAFFKNMYFRIIILVVFAIGFSVRIGQDWSNWKHWGDVFWGMCLITTIIGIILAIFFHSRNWCFFCPIGTLGNIIGGKKKQLKIDPNLCILCKKCEKKCPMQLEITSHLQKQFLDERDCIKCQECISVCPKNALKF